jgi:hypothetical protein
VFKNKTQPTEGALVSTRNQIRTSDFEFNLDERLRNHLCWRQPVGTIATPFDTGLKSRILVTQLNGRLLTQTSRQDAVVRTYIAILG